MDTLALGKRQRRLRKQRSPLIKGDINLSVRSTAARQELIRKGSHFERNRQTKKINQSINCKEKLKEKPYNWEKRKI